MLDAPAGLRLNKASRSVSNIKTSETQRQVAEKTWADLATLEEIQST